MFYIRVVVWVMIQTSAVCQCHAIFFFFQRPPSMEKWSKWKKSQSQPLLSPSLQNACGLTKSQMNFQLSWLVFQFQFRGGQIQPITHTYSSFDLQKQKEHSLNRTSMAHSCHCFFVVFKSWFQVVVSAIRSRRQSLLPCRTCFVGSFVTLGEIDIDKTKCKLLLILGWTKTLLPNASFLTRAQSFFPSVQLSIFGGRKSRTISTDSGCVAACLGRWATHLCFPVEWWRVLVGLHEQFSRSILQGHIKFGLNSCLTQSTHKAKLCIPKERSVNKGTCFATCQMGISAETLRFYEHLWINWGTTPLWRARFRAIYSQEKFPVCRFYLRRLVFICHVAYYPEIVSFGSPSAWTIVGKNAAVKWCCNFIFYPGLRAHGLLLLLLGLRYDDLKGDAEHFVFMVNTVQSNSFCSGQLATWVEPLADCVLIFKCLLEVPFAVAILGLLSNYGSENQKWCMYYMQPWWVLLACVSSMTLKAYRHISPCCHSQLQGCPPHETPHCIFSKEQDRFLLPSQHWRSATEGDFIAPQGIEHLDVFTKFVSAPSWNSLSSGLLISLNPGFSWAKLINSILFWQPGMRFITFNQVSASRHQSSKYVLQEDSWRWTVPEAFAPTYG